MSTLCSSAFVAEELQVATLNGCNLILNRKMVLRQFQADTESAFSTRFMVYNSTTKSVDWASTEQSQVYFLWLFCLRLVFKESGSMVFNIVYPMQLMHIKAMHLVVYNNPSPRR